MAKISRDEVVKIARISNIALHEQEIDAVVAQLEQVLSYAERVIEIADKGNAEAIARPHNIFRQDVAIPTPTQPILAQAPEREERYFVVPKILENA
ncbi:MAG: Asp-tRNA(Asn)/Glu-tRNA(Gln) amidotransferase subunit GatC [Candidatus Babeliales bacterium]